MKLRKPDSLAGTAMVLPALVPIFATLLALAAPGCGGSSSKSSTTATPTPTSTPTVPLSGKIAFSTNYDTGGVESQVYTMNANGSSITRLASVSANEAVYAWDTAGTVVLFSSNRNNNGGLSNNADIYTMDSNGANVKRITSDTSKNNITPSYSPDSANIVFSHGKQIATVPAGGGTITDLTKSPDVTGAYGPIFSPDGTKIVFIADRPGATNTGDNHSESLFVMNADGTSLKQLTTEDEYIHQVTWSHDGKWLVFDSTLETGGGTSIRTQLYKMAPDGTKRTRLTNNTALDISPAWSADDSYILFSSNRDHGGGTGGKNPFDFYALDVNANTVVRITNSGQNFFVGPQGWHKGT